MEICIAEQGTPNKARGPRAHLVILGDGTRMTDAAEISHGTPFSADSAR